jgi:hypothetical protein
MNIQICEALKFQKRFNPKKTILKTQYYQIVVIIIKLLKSNQILRSGKKRLIEYKGTPILH